MALSPTWRKLAQCVHGLFGRSNHAGPPTWTMASRLDSKSNLPKGGTVSFRWEARYGACMASLFPSQLVDRGFAPARYGGFNPRGRRLPHTTPCGRSVLGPEAVWRRSAPASRHRGSDAFSGRRVGGC